MSSALPRTRSRSLRTRLLFWYSAAFIVSAAVLALSAYLYAVRQLNTEADKFLADETAEFARQTAARMPDLADLKHYLQLEIGEKRHFEFFVRILDATSGKFLLIMPETAPGSDATLDPPEAPPEGKRGTLRRNTGESYRTQTKAIKVGGRTLILQCGIEVSSLYRTLARLTRYVTIFLVFTVLVAVVGGWIFAARSLKPVADMVQTLREIRSSDLSRRLPARTARDELGTLTTAINDMLGELEQSFRHVRDFTADVAHELRTPLATLRCELEVTANRERPPHELRETLVSALERTKTLAKIIENLLFLSKADAAASVPDITDIDLRPLLVELSETFSLAAEAKGVTLALDVSTPLAVRGNPDWLRILFGNLLDNAVKYTPPGGRISVKAARRKTNAEVTVEDTGPGMSARQAERIFDRFYRADQSRTRKTGGVGLGLSIAKRVTELHKGTITVRSQPGKGSALHVLLPLTDRPGPTPAAPASARQP